MKKSLMNTTKEITFPLFDEKIENLDNTIGQFFRTKWIKLEGVKPSSFNGVEEHFISKRSILLFSDGEGLKAFDKICTNCNSIAQWIAFEKKLKCFTCERTYEVSFEIGELCCKRYSTKEKAGDWFIEI